MSSNSNPSVWRRITNSSSPLLIDFYRDGCDGCIAMESVMKQLESRKNSGFDIISIDIEKLPQARVFFSIRSVPTLLLIKDGKVLWKQAGLMTAREIELFVAQSLSKE